MPSAAAYAAAEALVLPVEAQIMWRTPRSYARAAATTMPRSLKEPVGLHPSSLRYTAAQPASSCSRRARTSGVFPSPRVTSGVASVTGRRSAYRRSTPSRPLLLGRPVCMDLQLPDLAFDLFDSPPALPFL